MGDRDFSWEASELIFFKNKKYIEQFFKYVKNYFLI